MADFDNTNRGSIWKNERKETDKHPDFTGSINVEGKEFWLSAWKRKPVAKENSPALTFGVSPITGGGGAPKPKVDEDIPF